LQQLTTREFQVVFTGSVLDYRNPTYFNELLQLLNESGVRRHCVILGQISRAEMLQLICRSMSVIQPSFFEGWNTVVEECRALNVPILLSDIAVHREQAQVAGLQAAFFDPVTPEELARLMLEVLEGRLFDLADPAKGSLNEAWVRQNAQRYAAELVAVWNEATTQA
jgi:glycosyltransferase involved in cell wall biosynthesis